MEIELLYIKNCAHYKKALGLIHDSVTALGLKTRVREIEIKTEEDVKKHSFLGSPTIRINNEDLEPVSANSSGIT